MPQMPSLGPTPGPAIAHPLPPRRRRRSSRPALYGAIALALAVSAGAMLWYQGARPAPRALEAPAITPALSQAVLAALQPGWPRQAPLLEPGAPAVEGRIDAIAAADIDGDGAPEWAVSYVWLGPKLATGGRAAQPGFALLRGGEAPEVLYRAPATGGWNGPDETRFSDASEISGSVDLVELGPDGWGFMQRYALESDLGGRMSHGRARLYVPGSAGWTLAWEGETEWRESTGKTDEASRSAELVIEDLDGDGKPEIVLTPSFYRRHTDSAGRGPHFSALGPAALVYHRLGDQYVLSGALPPGASTPQRVRNAPVRYAVRADRPVRIDGDPGEWNARELVRLSGLALEDPALLKYRQRDRRGIEDISGTIQYMWDETALYVHAVVTDNAVVPGASGRDLYRGDHLALWIDRDLAGDFDQVGRSTDDWQIGFSPGRPAQAWAWVPTAGAHHLQVASRPHIDSYSGGVYGYELEAAIPWADLGGVPPGLRASVSPLPPSIQKGPARRYELTLAGMVGCAAVLTDADDRPQELAYVSHPGFEWGQPATFDTLLLIEPK